MNGRIEMGNDEFILYIRKMYPGCNETNNDLGRKIWDWIIEKDPIAIQTKEDAACYWGDTGPFIATDKLPKTATQFSFSIDILPILFRYLDELGEGKKNS
jgi:hypothetical protein